jgi:phospholipid/cholesterol/gamma-HCH transport system permease protein
MMLALREVGRCLQFVAEALDVGRRKGVSGHQVMLQIWKVTAQSLGTTALAGFFVGAIMAVQFTLQVKAYGALGYLGGLVRY